MTQYHAKLIVVSSQELHPDGNIVRVEQQSSVESSLRMICLNFNCSKLAAYELEVGVMDVNVLKETLDRAGKENGGLDALGMRFYARLFEKYPSVKPLFHAPREMQQKKLMASVGAIVASVANPEKLSPYLHAMGIRHLKYKTEDAHYPAVAENLIAVLKEHLSVEGQWTAEMESTWAEALNAVASLMIEAANKPDLFRAELKLAGYGEDGFRLQPEGEESLAAVS